MKFLDACVRLAGWSVKVGFILFALLVALRVGMSPAPQSVQVHSVSPHSARTDTEGFRDVPADHWAYSAVTISGNAAEADAILNAAIDKDDLRKVAALLESGARANAPNPGQYAPLVFVKSAAMTRLLVAHGGDVNSEDMVGNTPLNSAASNDLIEVAQTLIACGANPYAKNNSGFTAFDQANGSEHPARMKQALRSAWRERAIIERRRH